MRHRSRSRAPAGRRLNSLAGGGVFTPAAIPGLVLWLDPSYGLYQETTGASAATPAVAANDPVGTWKARNAAVYFSAVSTSGRPTLQFDAGKPYLLFDGVDDRLSAGDLSASFPSAGTLAWRADPDDAEPDADSGYAVVRTANNDSWDNFQGAASFPGQLLTTRLDTQPIVPATRHTVVIRSSASAWTRRLNGTQDISAAADFSGGAAWDIAYSVGASGTGVRYLHGAVAAVAAYSRAVSDAEAARLEAYLAGVF
jgi:hypothetical protein